MRNRRSIVLAALAVGGVAAGATLFQNSQEPAAPQAAFDPTAAQRAIESGREALHNVGHALLVAQRARRISRTARNKARRAQATANSLADEVNDLVRDIKDAAGDASRALTRASAALDGVDALDTRLDSIQTVSKTESASVSTPETSDYVPLGGPSVTVPVPASGLIQVWATVRFGPPTDGAVALYEDGQRVPVPGQDTNCTIGGLDDSLMVVETTGNPSGAMTVSTPPAEFSFAGDGCGTFGGAPGSMLFERSPGTHTYELRYADCGCDGQTAAFSNRTLRVAPLP